MNLERKSDGIKMDCSTPLRRMPADRVLASHLKRRDPWFRQSLDITVYTFRCLRHCFLQIWKATCIKEIVVVDGGTGQQSNVSSKKMVLTSWLPSSVVDFSLSWLNHQPPPLLPPCRATHTTLPDIQ